LVVRLLFLSRESSASLPEILPHGRDRQLVPHAVDGLALKQVGQALVPVAADDQEVDLFSLGQPGDLPLKAEDWPEIQAG